MPKIKRPTNLSLSLEDKERIDEIGKQMGITHRSTIVRALALQHKQQQESFKELSLKFERLSKSIEKFADALNDLDCDGAKDYLLECLEEIHEELV